MDLGLEMDGSSALVERFWMRLDSCERQISLFPNIYRLKLGIVLGHVNASEAHDETAMI